MTGTGEKLKVFVSYSRADQAFADELAAGLEVAGFTPLVDRNSIREGEDWQRRLSNLIAEAGTVVFILSPDSAKSQVCAWEVEEAAKLSKRILPALWRALDGTPAPARLAALNYIRFDEGRSLMNGIKALTKALNTDLDWLNEHTRLLSRAMEWEAGNRADNRLMSGQDIANAKAWAARRPSNAPALTALHLDFIQASERAQVERLSAERQRADMLQRAVQRTRAALAGTLMLAIAAGGAAYWASLKQREAVAQQQAAEKAQHEAETARQSLAASVEDLSAANLRLQAGMGLRIAPLGSEILRIHPNWHKVASLRASSVAFVQGADKKTICTAFVMTGAVLNRSWGERPVLVAPSYCVGTSQSRTLKPADAFVSFPVTGDGKSYPLSDVLWESTRDSNLNTIVIRLASALPHVVQPITSVTQNEFQSVARIENSGDGFKLTETALRDAPQIAMFGAPEGGPLVAFVNYLFAWSGDGMLNYHHSTSAGVSGAPIFDLENGELVALHQQGADRLLVQPGNIPLAKGQSIRKIIAAINADVAARN